ncbi:hypothetical protein [Streptomyces sp. NPDC050704]
MTRSACVAKDGTPRNISIILAWNDSEEPLVEAGITVGRPGAAVSVGT